MHFLAVVALGVAAAQDPPPPVEIRFLFMNWAGEPIVIEQRPSVIEVLDQEDRPVGQGRWDEQEAHVWIATGPERGYLYRIRVELPHGEFSGQFRPERIPEGGYVVETGLPPTFIRLILTLRGADGNPVAVRAPIGVEAQARGYTETVNHAFVAQGAPGATEGTVEVGRVPHGRLCRVAVTVPDVGALHVQFVSAPDEWRATAMSYPVELGDGGIRGTVMDDAGEPVPAAPVWATRRPRSSAEAADWILSYGANTDARGEYRIERLPAGLYTLSCANFPEDLMLTVADGTHYRAAAAPRLGGERPLEIEPGRPPVDVRPITMQRLLQHVRVMMGREAGDPAGLQVSAMLPLHPHLRDCELRAANPFVRAAEGQFLLPGNLGTTVVDAQGNAEWWSPGGAILLAYDDPRPPLTCPGATQVIRLKRFQALDLDRELPAYVIAIHLVIPQEPRPLLMVRVPDGPVPRTEWFALTGLLLQFTPPRQILSRSSDRCGCEFAERNVMAATFSHLSHPGDVLAFEAPSPGRYQIDVQPITRALRQPLTPSDTAAAEAESREWDRYRGQQEVGVGVDSGGEIELAFPRDRE